MSIAHMENEKRDISTYISAIEEKLLDFIQNEISYWKKVDEGIVPPLSALENFLANGGKRLRPSFCYLGYKAAGGDTTSPLIVDAGCALEMLHTFALVHDDIMDKADTRRGNPTVHKYLEKYYSDLNYVGDIEHFSTSVAILAGDFAFTYADSFTRELPSKSTDLYDKLKTELFAGQQMDLDVVYKSSISKQQVSLIAQYKSGKYSIERPIHFGLLVADENYDIAQWSKYGSPLGEAFQLRDDILGIFGDESLTGKPVGDDIREGKFTLLIAEALELANEPQKLILEKRGSENITNEDIEEISSIIESSGALKKVETKIDELYEKSVSALDKIDIDDSIKAYAKYLADYVCWRDT